MTNWQTKKLSEVCKLIKGKKPSKFVSKSSKLYLTAKVVRGTEIPEYASENCPSSVWVKKEDIVIIMDGSNFGEMFTGLEGALASTMGIVECQENLLNPKYLLHFLTTHRENFTKSRTGSAIPHLNKEEFENIQIPLSPIPTQHRIVKILDEVFEKIAKAKENAEKNLKNSKELFESYLQGVFANPEKDWEKKKLKEICSKLFAGGDVPKKNFSKIKTEKYNIPIFANGFKNKGLYGYTNIFKVVEPSITISARGTIGYAEIRKENFFPVVRLIVLTPDAKIIDLVFLYYMTHNFKFSNTGTSIPQLTIPMIENIKIPIPSLPEQKSIVAKLDALSAETKKLEMIYKKKLADLEELKKSVLKKAFNGELGTTHPLPAQAG